MPKSDNRNTRQPSWTVPMYQMPVGANPTIAQAQSAVAKKNTKRSGVVIAVVLAVVVIVAAICIWYFAFSGSFGSNSVVASGQAPYKTEEEMQAESERTIEDGQFNISIASNIDFEDGESEGVAYIENVPSNPYKMQVTLTDTESGDVLYESPILNPNTYIEKIRLNKDLDAGTHQAMATFSALDKQTEEQKGSTSAIVTLNVAN